jgi:dipeptidyl aminopeptidase/acylaminoacyl peptidase
MRGQFSAATTGSIAVLAHSATGRPMYDLTWRDRTGASVGTEGEPGVYFNLNLSRDEGRIVASRYWDAPDAPGRRWNVDIWAVDRTRAGTSTRLTFDSSLDLDPVWSPDGSAIVFTSARRSPSPYSLFRRPANGSADELVLKAESASLVGADWSPDGNFLLYSTWGDNRSLWMLPLQGDRTPRAFLDTQFNESAGVFSPDGRWVAYESDESGRTNVYVRPFPSGSESFQISRDGGRSPRWRGDGRELFFLGPDGTMMAAGMAASERVVRAAVPHALFQTGLNEAIDHTHPYAVLRDGQRFLMPVRRNPPGFAPITVLWNWPAR